MAGGQAGAGHRDVPVRRAGPADAATVIAVIGASHRAARDAGPMTWDEGPSAQWLGRKDLYSYLAGDDGFAAYQWAGDDLWVERVHARTPESLRALWSVIASHSSTADAVRGWTSPSDPFWWLTRERDASITQPRHVDAPRHRRRGGGRRPRLPAGLSVSVPLEVHDQARPANEGHWRLTVSRRRRGAHSERGRAFARTARPGPARPGGPLRGNPVATLRLAGLAAGGTPEGDASLDTAFAAVPYMVDDF